jgi:CIC family chloride channel protein
MASAYHAPLAGSLFIAEILFGTLMLASLGPVVISAVIALLLTQFLNGGAAPLYHVVLQQNLSALHYGLMLATGLLAGLCGPLFIWLMDYSHRGFVKLKLAPPWQLALGGLIVGGLSLITPAVWGNGYSVVQSYLLLPPSGALLVAYSCANCWRCWPAAAPARRAGSLPPRCLSAWRWACCLPASAGCGYRGMKRWL